MQFSNTITPFMPLVDKKFILDMSNIKEESVVFDKICSNAELFSSGRDALLRAIKIALNSRNDSSNRARKIFLPRYFCPWVIKSVLSQHCVRVEFFDDLPTSKTPDFSTLNAEDGDIVIAVNYFALRDFSVWDDWKSKHKDVVLIADFSHCPFSRHAQKTNADFVFASLRKTLPLCDGGYLKGNFTPNKMYLKAGEGCEFSFAYIYSAALAQIDYQTARDYYYNAEMRLNAKRSISRISFCSFNILKSLNLISLWEQRSCVADVFKDSLGQNEHFCVLENKNLSADVFSRFCPTLYFEDVSLRDKAYASLSEVGILSSIYWGAKFLEGSRAKEESSRLMTIPLDFRHTQEDAKKVADVLNKTLKI